MGKYLLLFLTLLMGVVGCSSQQATTIPATQAADSEVESTGADWLNLPLTNARTGETFTLADFAGKTVFLKPMAIW